MKIQEQMNETNDKQMDAGKSTLPVLLSYNTVILSENINIAFAWWGAKPVEKMV